MCLSQAESQDDLVSMFADQMPRFTHSSLTGEEVELIPNGRHVLVRYGSRLRSILLFKLIAYISILDLAFQGLSSEIWSVYVTVLVNTAMAALLVTTFCRRPPL